MSGQVDLFFALPKEVKVLRHLQTVCLQRTEIMHFYLNANIMYACLVFMPYKNFAQLQNVM